MSAVRMALAVVEPNRASSMDHSLSFSSPHTLRSDPPRVVFITVEFTGAGRTTCKQTIERDSRPPVQFMVRRFDCALTEHQRRSQQVIECIIRAP